MRNPTNEAAIQMLIYHIDRCYFEPHSKWPYDTIEEHAYERAAALEILQILIDNPDDDPQTLVEAYYDKVSYYWAVSKEDSKQDTIFSTAILVADDILHNIIYMI